MTVRAHFNGTVIVLDEPADLPVDVALEMQVSRTHGVSREVAAADAAHDPEDTARRLQALEEFVALGVKGTNIPLATLRREEMYDDRL